MRQNLGSAHPPLKEGFEDFPLWRREFFALLDTTCLPLPEYIRHANPDTFTPSLVDEAHKAEGRMALDHVLDDILSINVSPRLRARIRGNTSISDGALFLALETELTPATPLDRYRVAAKFDALAHRSTELLAEDFLKLYRDLETMYHYYVPENRLSLLHPFSNSLT